MFISEAVPSKVCTVFCCSNTGILGSDPTRGMHEMYSTCVFFLSRKKALRSNKFYRTSKSKRREENQLDATECFYCTNIICWTCFGHLHAHHQELETILVLLPRMVCDALVVDGRLLGAEQQATRPGWGKLLEQLPSTRTHSHSLLLYCVILSRSIAQDAHLQMVTLSIIPLHNKTCCHRTRII